MASAVSCFLLIMQVMADENLEDGDIEPAPKLIQVLFQNCRGQVDHWVEPYLRITMERLRRTKKPYLKCLLMEVVNAFPIWFECFIWYYCQSVLNNLGFYLSMNFCLIGNFLCSCFSDHCIYVSWLGLFWIFCQEWYSICWLVFLLIWVRNRIMERSAYLWAYILC